MCEKVPATTRLPFHMVEASTAPSKPSPSRITLVCPLVRWIQVRSREDIAAAAWPATLQSPKARRPVSNTICCQALPSHLSTRTKESSCMARDSTPAFSHR